MSSQPKAVSREWRRNLRFSVRGLIVAVLFIRAAWVGRPKWSAMLKSSAIQWPRSGQPAATFFTTGNGGTAFRYQTACRRARNGL